MTGSVKDKVIGIIAEQAMVETSEISTETSFEELGLDSLAMVEVVFGIEETFDVSVPYNANEPSETDFDLSSVGAVVRAVENLLKDKGDS